MEKVKKTQQEASRTLQEMHFSNTNSFPTGWRSAGGHQLLLLLVRAVRLAPADLSSRPPLQPLSARPQPPAPPAAREGGGRVHFELISAVKGSNNKINALGSSGPAERRGTRANGAGSSRGGGLENSTRSAFETQLPDPFCRCSGAGSSEPMGGVSGILCRRGSIATGRPKPSARLLQLHMPASACFGHLVLQGCPPALLHWGIPTPSCCMGMERGTWGQSEEQAAFQRSDAQQLASFLLLHSPEMENRRGRQGGEGGGEKRDSLFRSQEWETSQAAQSEAWRKPRLCAQPPDPWVIYVLETMLEK